MKVIKPYLILFFLFSSFLSQSQNIVDLFFMLPEEYSGYLDTEERKTIVNQGKLTDDEVVSNIFIDKENGFLTIKTSYNPRTESRFEMCYWNFNNQKLVAVSSYGGNSTTYSYGQTDFVFFIYANGKLEITNKPVFKNYYSNLEITKRFLITDFYSEMTREEILAYESLYPSLTFSLPRKGKNIEIKYENQKSESDSGPFFETPIKILKWNETGTFN